LGLPWIQGAIDVRGSNPYSKAKSVSLCNKHYSFKLKAYNMQLHAIVDHDKHFLDVFIGILGSMNNT
jgi:hypothetical protein